MERNTNEFKVFLERLCSFGRARHGWAILNESRRQVGWRKKRKPLKQSRVVKLPPLLCGEEPLHLAHCYGERHSTTEAVSRVTSGAPCPGTAAPTAPAGDNWVYRFSAFWLRSSVVSVLISLISDTSPIRGLHIKRIFGQRSRNRSLLRSIHVSARYSSVSGKGTPPSPC